MALSSRPLMPRKPINNSMPRPMEKSDTAMPQGRRKMKNITSVTSRPETMADTVISRFCMATSSF